MVEEYETYSLYKNTWKRIVSKSAETYTVVYSRIYLVSDNRHNRRIYIDAILRIKIAKPAEPVNGQDKRRIEVTPKS